MTQETEGRGKRRSAVLLSLALGAALAGMVAMAGTAQRADAASTEKIVFSSNRTSGTGVDNPTGDYEIFKMNPDGSGVRQLTTNEVNELGPVLSPDGTKIAYQSSGIQPSNPEGDEEVYVMKALDGTGKKNLTNNGAGIDDDYPRFSPGGKKIAYNSYGVQNSNAEGDSEVYVMNALDGTGKKNLTHNGVEVSGADPVNDYFSDFSPDGTKIAYTSAGVQTSNPEGDDEVYRMNALDGTGKRNLSNNGAGIGDYPSEFSPDGTKIAYTSVGKQNSNPEGDYEIYRMNTPDGTGKKNLTNNGSDVADRFPIFSPSGKKIVYYSYGKQPSNPEGDFEIYRLNANDGLGQTNLTDNGDGVDDFFPAGYYSGGTRIVYESAGVQTSNPEGDHEIYSMNAPDGSDQKNLTNNASDVFDGIYPD